MENREWIWDNGVLVEKDIESWKRDVEAAKRLALAEAKAEVFQKFLKKL